VQTFAVELDDLSLLGGLHPNEAVGFEFKAPRLDDLKCARMFWPDAPQEEGAVVGGEVASLCPAILDGDVLAFGIAGFAQALAGMQPRAKQNHCRWRACC
jgi:hypothetical protein